MAPVAPSCTPFYVFMSNRDNIRRRNYWYRLDRFRTVVVCVTVSTAHSNLHLASAQYSSTGNYHEAPTAWLCCAISHELSLVCRVNSTTCAQKCVLASCDFSSTLSWTAPLILRTTPTLRTSQVMSGRTAALTPVCLSSSSAPLSPPRNAIKWRPRPVQIDTVSSNVRSSNCAYCTLRRVTWWRWSAIDCPWEVVSRSTVQWAMRIMRNWKMKRNRM